MMLTFSVNPNVYEKSILLQTKALIESMDESPLNSEYLGEAFIKAAESRNASGRVNLTAYSHTCNKNDKNTAKNEVAIITQDELNQGYIGVVDVIANFIDTHSLDEVVKKVDTPFIVDLFLTVREAVLLRTNIDIYRLVQLAILDDKPAQSKLRNLINTGKADKAVEEYWSTNLGGKYVLEGSRFEDLLHSVLTNSACLRQLEELLC